MNNLHKFCKQALIMYYDKVAQEMDDPIRNNFLESVAKLFSRCTNLMYIVLCVSRYTDEKGNIDIPEQCREKIYDYSNECFVYPNTLDNQFPKIFTFEDLVDSRRDHKFNLEIKKPASTPLLSANDCRNIIKTYKEGTISMDALGKKYGVCGATICKIINNKYRISVG